MIDQERQSGRRGGRRHQAAGNTQVGGADISIVSRDEGYSRSHHHGDGALGQELEIASKPGQDLLVPSPALPVDAEQALQVDVVDAQGNQPAIEHGKHGVFVAVECPDVAPLPAPRIPGPDGCRVRPDRDRQQEGRWVRWLRKPQSISHGIRLHH